MKAYKYKESREFEKTVDCQIDPRATEREGHDVWLLPADCTFDEPPAVGKHQVSVWNGEKWEIKVDWRGCLLYNPKTKETTSISEVGKDKPEGYLEVVERNQTPYYTIEVKEDGVYFVDRPMNNEEKTKEAEEKRKLAYREEIDELHAQRTRRLILGTWTDDDESNYVEQVKAISADIAKRYPYPE